MSRRVKRKKKVEGRLAGDTKQMRKRSEAEGKRIM